MTPPARRHEKPLVAIYRTQLLPLSETFVRDQALALQRWRPVLVGERTIDALPLCGLATQAHHHGPATFGQRLRAAGHRALGCAPPACFGIVRELRPDLLHAHFGFDGVEAWPIARRLGIPLLVTLHGADITVHMDWYSTGRAGWRWRQYPERLAALAKDERVSFVAVSHNIYRAAISSGLPESRTFVRPIGVDAKQFKPSGCLVASRPPSILFVGRLVEKKGCTYLIEAFERVRSAVPGAELVIAGDGPERGALMKQARCAPDVIFLGAVSHGEVRRRMAQARVFCLPSVTAGNGDAEGLPIVLLEAQASGLPIVTSARGGVSEGILDAETGFAFRERDIGALSDHLIRLLTNVSLAAQFSTAGPLYVAREHDIHRCTAALETLYDDIVAFAPGGPACRRSETTRRVGKRVAVALDNQGMNEGVG